MNTPTPTEQQQRCRIGVRGKFSLLLYLIILLSLCVVGYYGYSSTANAYRQKAEAVVSGYTSQVSKQIDAFLKLTRSDLTYFATSNDLRRHLYWQDVGDQRKARQWLDATLESWRDFVHFYDYLYKVRFFDMDGIEQISVRRDPISHQVAILPVANVPQKNSSAYYRNARELPPNKMLVSALNLNQENGKIEQPYVPVLILSQPMYGENQTQYGVVAVNLFADNLFAYVRQANNEVADSQFVLMNANGDYLYHPQEQRSFGHLLGHKESFFEDFPSVKQQLGNSDHGTIFTRDHVISFQRIYPQTDNPDYYWILAGAVEETTVMQDLNEFKWAFALMVTVVLLLAYFSSSMLLNSFISPLLFVTRQLQQMSRGEPPTTTLHYRYRDEIGLMLQSISQLARNTEMVAHQTDIIASGDFTQRVQLLSEKDRLGLALNNMTQMLQQNREQSEQLNWHKDGISQLNQQINGSMPLQQLADSAIGCVGRYLDAGRGVMHLYDTQQQLLQRIGSYMYTEPNHSDTYFRIGEGTIGQAAREKQPIMLRHITADSAPIRSGTSSNPPLYSYTQPLLQEQQLLGVFELASFTPFSPLQQQFISDAAEVIASVLAATLQQRKISQLLLQAEQAATDAKQKSERLAIVNQQMEQQQLQLQQQKEELMQSNQHMAAQQQQLQQQAEELQQSNAQMEEQQQLLEQQTIELERNNADLRQSKEQLRLRAEELQQASQYKSEFLANMSHELRTPLNSIILLSKMLAHNQDGHLAEEELQQAEVIHQAGGELLRLITDILDLSKVEAGKMEIHPAPLDIEDMLQEFRNLFQSVANSKQLEFRIDNQLGSTTVITDRDKLSQILRNLLSNAFKFTDSGYVALSVTMQDNPQYPLAIAVEDSGIGIPAEKQQIIFEAFQQVDGSVSRQYGGTGLGLSISLRFSELLGGTITLQSNPDSGSRFTLLLPLQHPATVPHKNHNDSSSAKNTTAPQPPPVSLPVATEKHSDDRLRLLPGDAVILVIDDDADFASTIASINRKLGYKTLIAHSGAEGIRMAKAYLPGGILLDMGLPDMDGSAVLHELKTTRELRPIPVYILSGKEQESVAIHNPIVGYMQKPVSSEQLAEMEDILLRRSGSDHHTLLVVEGGSLQTAEIIELLQQHELTIITAKDDDSARQQLQHTPALAIIDTDRDHQQCMQICRALQQSDPLLPLLLYGTRQLTAEEEAELRHFSDSVIMRSSHAGQRILENIEHFLQESVGTATQRHANPTRSPAANSDDRKLRGQHILVVDDDPRNLFVITSALELAGATVTSALNGVKAMQFLEQDSEINLIFMDIMMPEMDGYQTMRAIKQSERLRHIPVVALTAKALQSDMEQALAAGADDFLSKPVEFEVLINMAHIWCQQS